LTEFLAIVVVSVMLAAIVIILDRHIHRTEDD